MSEKEHARARRKAEGRNKHRERKEREERRKLKHKMKEMKGTANEVDKRDRGGKREAIERKVNGNRTRADEGRQRQSEKEPKAEVSGSTVARVKVIRSAVSGNFDALGL